MAKEANGFVPFPNTENVEYKLEGDSVLIRMSLKHRGQVTEKGNARVASTLGNKTIPGTAIQLGINGYTKA